MFDLLSIIAFFNTGKQIIEETLETPLPAENWANKELYYKDLMSGMPVKQISKNAKNGKYKLSVTHPEPHRDSKGKIIIENSLQYKADLKKYGSYKTMQWVRQGKYNLTPEELKKEDERIKQKFESLYKLVDESHDR